MDQHLEKADNIVSNVNNTSQSLVQLQMMHSWLQVKLRQSPSPPSGALAYASATTCKYDNIEAFPACRIGWIALLFWIAIIECKK